MRKMMTFSTYVFLIFFRMRGSPFIIIRRAEIDDLRFIRGVEVYKMTFPWVSIKIIRALWSFFIFQQECRTFFLPSWCWYGVGHTVQAQGWRFPPPSSLNRIVRIVWATSRNLKRNCLINLWGNLECLRTCLYLVKFAMISYRLSR